MLYLWIRFGALLHLHVELQELNKLILISYRKSLLFIFNCIITWRLLM